MAGVCELRNEKGDEKGAPCNKRNHRYICTGEILLRGQGAHPDDDLQQQKYFVFIGKKSISHELGDSWTCLLPVVLGKKKSFWGR